MDERLLKQAGFLDYERNINKKSCFGKASSAKLFIEGIFQFTIIRLVFFAHQLMTYSNLNADPELLKIKKQKTTNLKNKNINKTEKHGYENNVELYNQ